MNATHLYAMAAAKKVETATPKSFFNALTAYGLLGLGVGFTGMLLLVFSPDGALNLTFSPPVVFVFLAFLFAALIYYTKWRWTPLLGILYALVQVVFNVQRILNVMAAAESTADFFITPIMLVLIFITLAAGMLALYHNYSNKQYTSQMPLWVAPVLYVLLGSLLGIFSLGYLLPDQNQPLAGLVTENIPVISLNKPQKEIFVEAGQPVLVKLENNSPFTAALHVESLNVQTVIRKGESFLYLYPEKAGKYKYVATMSFYKRQAPEKGQMNPNGERIEGFIIAK